MDESRLQTEILEILLQKNQDGYRRVVKKTKLETS
jgi:hypothetical protein